VVAYRLSLQPANHAAATQNIFDDRASINVLCLPNEVSNNVTGFRRITGPHDWWENPPD
jgi:hypothetical protein